MLCLMWSESVFVNLICSVPFAGYKEKLNLMKKKKKENNYAAKRGYV